MRVWLRVLLAAAALLLVSVSGYGRPWAFGATHDAAATAVAAAESALVDCYLGVLDAEGAGANVSALVARLNVATGYLTEAQLRLRSGNFSGAVDSAGLVGESLDGVVDEAGVLHNAAALARAQQLSWAVGGSIVGVVVVGVLGVLGWGYVKGRHVRRVLTMTPEVADVAESG